MIPACEELALLPGAIESLALLPYRKVVVVVLNQRENAPQKTIQNNRVLRELLLQWPHQLIEPLLYQIKHPSEDLDILLLDRVTHPLEKKEGVLTSSFHRF